MTITERPPRRAIAAPGRVPPHNLDAEASVLGAVLLSTDALDAAQEAGLTPAAFYRPAHQHIFEAIEQLCAGAEPVDTVTVAEQLRRNGLLDQVGGVAALHELQNVTPSISNCRHYARVVVEAYLMRRMILTAADISDLAYSPAEPASVALDRAEQLMYRLSAAEHVTTVADADELAPGWAERFQARVDAGGGVTGLATGLEDLDRLTCGLQPGALYVIGARPSVGKSALALGIAAHVAVNLRLPTLFESLEMPHDELIARLLSWVGRIDGQRLRAATPTDDDWVRMGTALQQLHQAPLVFDDDSAATVGAIRARARRVRQRYGDLRLIVVDYLQLVSAAPGGRSENRQLQVDEIARQLKLLARDLAVPVIATAQVGRAVELRADKRPQLSDLRESGAIEAHADAVFTLYRDELYDPNSADRGLAELALLKHRSGPTGMVRLAFIHPYALFASAYRP